MRVRRSLAAIIPENLGARPSTIMPERPRPTNTTGKAITQSRDVNGNFVRIADIHFFSREGLLAYQESNSSALFALIGLFKQSYNTHLRL